MLRLHEAARDRGRVRPETGRPLLSTRSRRPRRRETLHRDHRFTRKREQQQRLPHEQQSSSAPERRFDVR